MQIAFLQTYQKLFGSYNKILSTGIYYQIRLGTTFYLFKQEDLV